jgi:hypothetical protein
MLDNTAYDWDASFDDLLRRFRQAESVSSEDVVGALRSLFEDCRDLHETGRVAALHRIELLSVSPTGEVSLGRVPIGEAIDGKRVAEVDAATTGEMPSSEPPLAASRQLIGAVNEPPRAPLYYPGYTSWEELLGHHDALTDIFHLGMLMASLATRLDFRAAADLEATLARFRQRIARELR